jgi:hypothetical protein
MSKAGLSRKSSISALKAKPKQAMTGRLNSSAAILICSKTWLGLLSLISLAVLDGTHRVLSVQ